MRAHRRVAYLRKFPFDKIKIDRSFIRDMSTRRESLERLRAEGCTEVQGYIFSPPVRAGEVQRPLASLNPKLKAIA